MYYSLSRAVLVILCSPVQKSYCKALVSPRAAVWLQPDPERGFICCPSLGSLETIPAPDSFRVAAHVSFTYKFLKLLSGQEC